MPIPVTLKLPKVKEIQSFDSVAQATLALRAELIAEGRDPKEGTISLDLPQIGPYRVMSLDEADQIEYDYDRRRMRGETDGTPW